MSLEQVVSSTIVRQFGQKLLDHLVTDVAIVGGGPSALVAAYYLRQQGLKTAIFERRLAPGGGVWGGGMLFNEIVVQDEAAAILDEFGIRHESIADAPGYRRVDSVEMASGLIFGAVHAGAVIFNAMCVEDVVFKENRIGGLVINWTPVERLGMFVDPLMIMSKAVLDATGHPCAIVNKTIAKGKIALNTPTGGILGERPMWAESGEETAVSSADEYYPGLFACGMSSNAVVGGYRMGPIFGGMLKSGKRIAERILASMK